MNEEVINDLYNNALSKGYRGSREAFISVLHSNDAVMNDMFSYVKSNGYRGQIDNFKNLVGATSPVVESPMTVQPKKKEDTTALPSGGGSSASSALTPDPEALRFAELVKKQGEVVGKRRDEPSYIDPRKTLGMYPTKEQADKATAQAMADINVTTGERKEPEKKGGKSYLENIALNLGLGASYANEAFLSIPESVVNLLAIPQNYIAEKTGLPIGVTAEGIKESWGITNPLLDYVKESQKAMSGEVSKFMAERYEDPSIKGNFEKGNYREGFELLGSAITQSLPTSVGLMIGGAYTAPSKLATVATLGFTEDQREELAAMDPTMSEAEKTLKAAGMAAMESVFSSIGTGTLGKVYKDIAKREGADAAKNILKDGLVIAYETALKKGGLPVAVAGNSLEEGAVRLSQNVISGRPIMDGVIDAFITGGGSGVVFGAPISAVNAKRYIENKITSYDTKSKVIEILKDKADNMAQVYNVPVSSEITTSQLEISNLPNSRNLLVNNLKKSVSDGQITEEDAKQSLFVFDKIQQVSNAVKDLDVSQEDKARIATLLRQRDDLRTKIQNKDDVLVVQEKRQIEDINNQIQEILSAPKQEAASYKVDGKDVTVEAIDELIKTKSKEELLAMNIEVNNDQSGVAERLQAAIETKPIQQDAIQEQAAGQVPVQPGTGVSQEVAQGEPQAEPQGVTQEGQVQEEVAPTQEVDFTEEEVSELEKAISKNLPEYFQLATKKESPEKMAVLTDAATKLMDQVQPEIVKESEVVEQPSIDTIPITVTENVELANKVPKMSVNDLVGKKVNYVMADQLKVDDELMGGPFFPLMDDTFGKVAWASMDEDAAKNIIRGFIKGDYSVVYNMSPSAIDSNIATLNEFVKRLNSIPASENIYPQISEYLKGRKFGKDTKAIQDLVDKSSNLESFIDGFKSLNVDQKQAIIKAVLPSKSVNATTKLGSTLQNNNITQESVREAISEQFARDLPMGAMTMVLEITDAEGNPIKSEADIDKAIMTRDQQVAEGIRPHKNYPVYIRGRAVAMLSDTVPVWNVSSRALDTMNKKAAGILQKKVPQPEGAVEGTQETRRFSAAEIRADEMYTLQRSSTRAEEVLVPMNTQYQIFVEKLSKAIPSVEIVTSQVEFDNLMNDLNAKKLATKNQKIYGAVLNGKLYLNPGLENFNTPIHEFGHVWMNTVKELSPEIYNKGIDLIKNSEYVSQVDENPEYNRVTKKMKEDGMTDEQIRQYVLEEALATAIGDKGESFVNASQKRNFKNWLNELFQFIKKLTGISKLTPEQIQDLSLDDFLNSVVVDLLSEKPIFKNAEVRNLNNQLQLMARPDLKADDIVKIGLANGFSEGSIRELLKRRGFTQEEINRAVASTVQAAKKVEVTEEFAPGYNRVLNEIFGKDGVVARSRRRGRSEEETMQNAIDYLEQDTKVYENATDVQREAMVRNVRKEFKKREKAAPSAKKVLGQKKDVVTVTVDLAKERDRIIREQIKLAKEVTGDLNQKRAALADAIRLFEDGGVITTAQTKTIVNRISKVNLNNPIMVDRLLAYIEKVFDNANYAADMAELRKLQKQAKSRNHTSMTNVVKQFTSINPENIPLDRIQDYKEALDFLNNRTPFYGNMNDIFDEMLSYQISEEFDAIKTMEALEKKYEDIMSNQVKNVEDYVNLIKDINSFKRKAFQLLQNEEITQKNYDDLINMVGKDQQTIEENYKDEITKIKKDLIAEIKNQRPKVSRDFSNVENDLIRKYLELSDADLESLSPEDLFVLNDLLDNISNGEIDNFRFNEIISKAYTSDGANRLAKQIDDSKFDMTPEEGTKELSEYESSFWEGLLGMGRAKSGALQKFVVSVFNRAIASYENLTRDGYNKFLKIKDEYKMSDKDMHKIGMLTTYLQEYMAQFDPKNEGIKDIGKRDWFKEILNSKSMRGKYSSGKPSILKVVGLGKSEIDIIEEIWDSLPKDKDGNVDPKAVYDSYMANDGKFFTKNQKGFFDDIMDYKASEITPKQKFANEINGASFKEIPFHMMRVRLDGGRTQITPTASSDNGVVRIKAGTGKERVSEAVGPIMTNFEKLFITNLEQTGRDYFLSGALKDINNTLSGAKKKIDPDKMPILDTISGTLSEALGYEFDRTQSNFIFRNLLSARAAMTLLRPIRTVTELGSTLLSYPVRAKTLSGYKSLFGEQGAMKKLLEFTNSPMLLRDNINKAIDINDGRIEPQSRFTKATNYLSGLPERTMMITSWMPTFKSEFKNSTGIDFDINKFNTSEVYREKYGKAIREASAAADAQTEKIIGPTVKAGQRREVRIAPKVLANIIGLEGTVPKNSAAGQILGFFSNYPYREVTEFINGFKEAAEVIKDEGALSSLSQLQKPLGIALNVAAYGFLGTLTYAGQLILLGDEDDEERGIKLLKDIMTTEGLLNELASNAISLAGSKYAAGGKALLQLAATIAIESTDDEEQKAKIKKLLKDSVFVDPLPVEQAAKFGGRDKALSAIAMYIPQFVIFADRYADFIGGINEFEAIYDKVESKGVESLTQDEGTKILALNTIINASQILLNVFGGTSLPEYNNIKTYMKKLKEEAGVADVYKGESLAKKKSSGGGGGGRAKTMNKSDLKKYFPEQYNELYGEGSATYEIEQEVKAFEKEQREMKKRIKDQVYGGKD